MVSFSGVSQLQLRLSHFGDPWHQNAWLRGGHNAHGATVGRLYVSPLFVARFNAHVLFVAGLVCRYLRARGRTLHKKVLLTTSGDFDGIRSYGFFQIS